MTSVREMTILRDSGTSVSEILEDRVSERDTNPEWEARVRVCSRERDTDLEYYVFFTDPDDLIKYKKKKK